MIAPGNQWCHVKLNCTAFGAPGWKGEPVFEVLSLPLESVKTVHCLIFKMKGAEVQGCLESGSLKLEGLSAYNPEKIRTYVGLNIINGKIEAFLYA